MLKNVRRLGRDAIEVQHEDGTTHVILFGSQTVDTSFGTINFEGDFAQLRSDDEGLQSVNALGCSRLVVDGEQLVMGTFLFQGTLTAIDLTNRSVTLDRPLPKVDLAGMVATFSNPAYTRNTGYHVAQSTGDELTLDAGTLALGTGRAWEIRDANTLLSDIPHEYARHVRRKASQFFDGKLLQGEGDNTTRVRHVEPGNPMTITVEDASVFQAGEGFQYLDIAPGDEVRIALPFTWKRNHDQ